jgi:hypothetical protein
MQIGSTDHREAEPASSAAAKGSPSKNGLGTSGARAEEPHGGEGVTGRLQRAAERHERSEWGRRKRGTVGLLYSH